MDDNTTATTISQDQISLFVGGSLQNLQEMHPFSSSSSSSYCHPLEMGHGEDSGAGSEEGLDVPEEPAKVVPHRSGSKRSRAAEVHNLSEKRRRSRINEKMKALQNLIPNSNKTDKASMLDEAIEYLKQLQLQVQMLSMRNSLTSHPMYLAGSLHPLQASQLCMNFGENTSTMNLGELGLLNLNQDSAMNSSFDLTNQCTTSHPSVVLPTASISAPVSSFVLETSQPHHAAFQLGIHGQATFTEEMVSQRPFDSSRTTANLSENVMKTIEVGSSHFGVQASSSLDQNGHLAGMFSKDHHDNNPIFIQSFDGLQANRSITKDNTNTVKSEAQGL